MCPTASSSGVKEEEVEEAAAEKPKKKKSRWTEDPIIPVKPWQVHGVNFSSWWTAVLISGRGTLSGHLLRGRTVSRCQNWGNQRRRGGFGEVQRFQVRSNLSGLLYLSFSTIFTAGVFLCPPSACSSCHRVEPLLSMLRYLYIDIIVIDHNFHQDFSFRTQWRTRRN